MHPPMHNPMHMKSYIGEGVSTSDNTTKLPMHPPAHDPTTNTGHICSNNATKSHMLPPAHNPVHMKSYVEESGHNMRADFERPTPSSLVHGHTLLHTACPLWPSIAWGNVLAMANSLIITINTRFIQAFPACSTSIKHQSTEKMRSDILIKPKQGLGFCIIGLIWWMYLRTTMTNQSN